MANRAAKAMRQTSPARPFERSAGFTLVELLVAILILSILVAAAARGLMTSLHTDESSALLFEGGLLLQRIEAAAARGSTTNETAALVTQGWQFREELVRASTSNDSPWRVWTVAPERRPSMHLQRAIRAD